MTHTTLITSPYSICSHRNYKGWESILVVAFVNSFYLFVDGDVGAPGRSGDNTVLQQSWLLEEIKKNPVLWLGEDGVIAADGGASDGGKLLLNPIPNAREPDDCYYNFCHSSTRFFVEETFGRWKNRFRFLLTASDLDHRTVTLLIYVSLILHNVCTIHKDDAVDFMAGTDDGWMRFFHQYNRLACPSCTRRNAFHCSHNGINRKTKARKADSSAALRQVVKKALWDRLDDPELEGEMEQRAGAGSD